MFLSEIFKSVSSTDVSGVTSTVSVSYTHLDVYKRQAHSMLCYLGTELGEAVQRVHS